MIATTAIGMIGAERRSVVVRQGGVIVMDTPSLRLEDFNTKPEKEAKMSKSIVQWDSLDTSTQERIEAFYRDLWNDEVISFIQESPTNQSAIEKALCLSKQVNREIHKADFGFVRLEWKAHPEKDSTSLVSIQAGYIGGCGGSQDDSDDATSTIISHVVRCEQNGLLPIFSIHGKPTSEQKKENGIIVFCPDEDGVLNTIKIDSMPFACISTGIDMSVFAEVKDRDSARKKARANQKELEVQKEDELYDWLRLRGVDVERQVKTSEGHRLDMWMPGKMIIEVKRGAVSGNDVCQCIEYAAEYSVPIVLIGDKLTTSASRGLHGFNKLHPKKKISFVSWDTAFDYLRGFLTAG